MPDVPPIAHSIVDAVAHVLSLSSAIDLDSNDGDLRELACDVLEAAAPLITAAERERLYAELGNDHYVIFTEDRWTMEHTVECRLSGHMHECSYHTAASLIAAEFDPDMAGRWRIDGIDSEGLPDLVRAEVPQ
jgi:hypothetical protein